MRVGNRRQYRRRRVATAHEHHRGATGVRNRASGQRRRLRARGQRPQGLLLQHPERSVAVRDPAPRSRRLPTGRRHIGDGGGGAPEEVPDATGGTAAPNALVLDRDNDAQFANLAQPEFAQSAAVVLPFGKVLAVAGFRCNVQEQSGVSCVRGGDRPRFHLLRRGLHPALHRRPLAMAHDQDRHPGWSYDHWTDVLYPRGTPAKSRLAHYAGEFDTVELNGSFYRWPAETTFTGWSRAGAERFHHVGQGASRPDPLPAAAVTGELDAAVRALLAVTGPHNEALLVQLHPALERDDGTAHRFPFPTAPPDPGGDGVAPPLLAGTPRWMRCCSVSARRMS